MNVVCMIPARLGSQRIKKKALRYLGDKPLVAHVIETCTKADIFDRIYLNSENLIFKQIAERYRISFYHRDKKLAASNVTNDLFVEDFLKHIECQYVIQVNPTSPFITVDDLIHFKKLLLEGKYGTIQSIKSEKIEALYESKPLNYDPKKIMPKSQDLKPVMLYSSGIMGFRRDTYLKNMTELGAATYGGNESVGYYELKGFSTIDIDYEEDFLLAEVVYDFLAQKTRKTPRYYSDRDKNLKPMKSDPDRERILIMDGVEERCMNEFNKEVINIPELIEQNGREKAWAHTVINSPSNCATLICQLPGEGNRMHFHPDWEEWWYIVEGEWEWLVEGVAMRIKQGDVVFIERNKKHMVKAKGDQMAIRLAVSRHDVAHVYEEGDY